MLEQDTSQWKTNIAQNLLTLRRQLKLTQREFIDTYLLNNQGEPLISVSTLSGIENGTQDNIQPLITSITTKMEVDANIFSMDPDSFAKNSGLFFKSLADAQIAPLDTVRKGSTVESLVNILSNRLADEVISGKLKPGAKLPSDRSLSTEYGVGRSTIREALKVLSVLGLINILPGQGTFIAMEPSDFFLMPLSWTLFLEQRDAHHILDVRHILEAEAARLAAQKSDSRSLSELKMQYERMQSAYKTANFEDFLDSDLEFHLAIAKCSGNPIIHSLLQTLRKLLSYISGSGMVTIEQLHEIADEHSAIYTSISKGDAEGAKRWMQTHLENSRGRYRL